MFDFYWKYNMHNFKAEQMDKKEKGSDTMTVLVAFLGIFKSGAATLPSQPSISTGEW